MTAFDTLKEEIAARKRQIEVQEWVLAMVDEVTHKLASHGVVPEILFEEDVLSLHVDLGEIRAITFQEAEPAGEARGTDDAAEAAESEPAAADESPAPEAELETCPGGVLFDPEKNGTAWSAGEILTAKKMLRAGRTGREIATELQRTLSSVSFKCSKLRKGLDAKTPNPAAAGSKPSDPAAPAPGASAPVSPPEAAPGPRPRSERELQARLDRLGNPDPWTPQADLQLVEGLARGGIAAAADTLRLTKDDCRERFKALHPGALTIEGQAELLKVLRSRASA